MTEQSVIASASAAFEPPRFSTVDEERAHRKGHLAVAYQFFAHMGYDHWVAGHITVRDPEQALSRAAARVVDWAAGTRIGASLKQYNDVWGRRALTRGAVVLIVSDGWERPPPSG